MTTPHPAHRAPSRIADAATRAYDTNPRLATLTAWIRTDPIGRLEQRLIPALIKTGAVLLVVTFIAALLHHAAGTPS